MKPEIEEKIKLLEEKYSATGQDLAGYLDGLLYAEYLTYWDYIHLDTLLSLQNPKTAIPDEKIFIMYHQITELYFKLCLHEFEQLAENTSLTVDFLIDRVNRINRYFLALIDSFSIMVDGMDPKQFLKFRMSLLPASGFQSAQYRMIEICATNFSNLVSLGFREKFSQNNTVNSIEEMFSYIYWKTGATELSSGKKTYTLVQFEDKYATTFIDLGKKMFNKNILNLFHSLNASDQKNEQLIKALRNLDTCVNVNWPLAHYKSAVRYLQRDGEDVAATGGTNWQKYLPPRFQKRIFYPELWSENEKMEWGKSWVDEIMKNIQ